MKNFKYTSCRDGLCGATDCPRCSPERFRSGIHIDELERYESETEPEEENETMTPNDPTEPIVIARQYRVIGIETRCLELLKIDGKLHFRACLKTDQTWPASHDDAAEFYRTSAIKLKSFPEK